LLFLNKLINRLSQLTIDTHKDWGGYRIENVGAPLVDTDVPRARAGDILSGRFSMARMPDGAAGEVLTAQGPGVDPAYAPVAGGYTEGARVYRDSDIALSAYTAVLIGFNQQRYDTDNIHDPVTNNSRLTCQTPGKYLIIGNVRWSGGATGLKETEIRLNGSTYIAGVWSMDETSVAHCVTTVYNLNAGDYVELYVWAEATTYIKYHPQWSPEFMMQRIG